ncbi:2-oxoacid:ferredoxin oxidoreductase subunit beta [Marinithermus hydrothermalis]|uniref:Pyruvate ferredoxin/flavodoxin oxidoreductase, beta subunit n=1 Tax=Marinithermus hydrothermalis (strain DSM 14884 / JCM 11576 / T1) TaxID=869210 RepID=F2NL43_MARHT|nr:2-oxoacid:ferredoxin oxidoreductase subunit beta [Marinithermus hydrothermalis]AEB11446.1 pyruvate ferredoxin/flavodoxin oxidoreductase, beta subunit [Marinithermus hydrothermalis DSM 14884]
MIELKLSDYKAEIHSDWCPGCGDYGILNALQMALSEMKADPTNTVVFSGIGCAAKTPHYMQTYGVHTLHGRVLPIATGAKLANPDLTVVAVGGDGDGLGIGAGHFVGSGRRNVDLLYLIYDNEVYGLTKGQASPTLALGEQPKSLPHPNAQGRINPLMLALSAGYTFIARAYAYDVKHLKALIKAGIEHKGLAVIDVLQPCPTYNNLHTKEWFGPRVYKLEEEGYDPNVPADASEEERAARIAAFAAKAAEWGERIPIGIFWQEEVSTFQERIAAHQPDYFAAPPAKRRIMREDGRPVANLEAIFAELAL